MSSKRNRNARRNRSRRVPRTRATSGRVSPPRPRSARSATRNPVVRRGISGQHVGRVRTVPSRGRGVPAMEAEASPDPLPVRSPPPTSSAWSRLRRRLSTSTVALVGIVALEVGALAVLGVHLASGGDEVATVAASGFYAAPVHLPAGTAYVRSRVVAPGTLVVTHWIHADRDVDSVRVQVPEAPGPGPRAVAVSDLVVASDGRSIREATLVPGQVLTTFTVPPGRRIFVSYVLTGAVPPQGSQPGKGLAQVTALDVSAPPVTVTRTAHHVLGARLLGLECSPPLPDAVPRPCGRASGDGWRVDLLGGHSSDRVLARLDLP